MAALVQSLPSQTATVTMLPPSPGSSPASFGAGSSATTLHPHRSSRPSPLSRTLYGGSIGSLSSFRGPVTAPVAPYAFTATPVLNHTNTLGQVQAMPLVRAEHRTALAPASAPVTASGRTMGEASITERNSPTLPIQGPVLPATGASGNIRPGASVDDTTLSVTRPAHVNTNPSRPLLSLDLSPPPSLPSPVVTPPATKPSPERYRRPQQRKVDSGLPPVLVAPRAPASSASDMAALGPLPEQPSTPVVDPSSTLVQPANTGVWNASGRVWHPRQSSVDDMELSRPPKAEIPQRYRRQTVGGIEGASVGEPKPLRARPSPSDSTSPHASAVALVSPDSEAITDLPSPARTHRRTGSGESGVSAQDRRSRSSSFQRELPLLPVTPPTLAPAVDRQGSDPLSDARQPLQARLASNPSWRSTMSSPLSRPIGDGHAPAAPVSGTPHSETDGRPTTAEMAAAHLNSPAAQHLAELNEKEAKKGVKSRLRRAFSFSSAAELRRASAENSMNHASADRAKLRKDRYQNERDAEQAAVAERQEAAGLGQSIYSGQGGFATGSTDNLSISSTASSASIMIRKMGKGMKKSTRSLVGLFRPKSMIGAPTDEGGLPPAASAAQVSMVTVEAEREKVNVNVDPHDQAGGGTGFPRLERNSMDATAPSAAGHEPSSTRDDADGTGSGSSRRSIVGGDQERAEVLAAVKKGILKRYGVGSAQSSPVVRPMDGKPLDFQLPAITLVSDSPHSTAPSTPVEENASLDGSRRPDAVRIEGEDYFVSRPPLAPTDGRSLPETPQSVSKFNVTFSPRIQFHDTWPSGEYDRRGETATCNRLTPMLAQQIKEELNSFKMEMEVHEQSKVYTHFF